MRFGVLGPLEVGTDDGRPVVVPELKVRVFLAALLVRAGRRVSYDRLIDDLWPSDAPGKPVNALRVKASQLRRVLREAEPDGPEIIMSSASGYVLDVERDAVDARRFEAEVARAAEVDDPRGRAAILAGALALWRGPAFAGFEDEEFVRPAVARLEESRLAALEDLARARLALGEHAALVGELGDLVQEHPLRERFRGALMLALYRSGRQNEALSCYRELRERLREELGLDPGPELAALHQAILEHDAALDAPPRTVTTPRATVPAPMTALVGRDDDVAALRAALDSSRLVTLAGPGGVGKTRLAVEALRERPAGTVVFAELAPLAPETSAPEDVAELVAAALALPGGWRDEPAGAADRLPAVLDDGKTLLVLDGCEHVIEPVAKLADLLLKSAPGLRILATSQEPLAISGETVRTVPPLPRDAAVRLFTERAAASAPGFALDETNADAVAEICARLDGLPLALELAAARVRALGVHGLAEGLDDRFRVLNGGRRGGPTRHRTLRAVIDWSWEPLSEQERALLRRMAVHTGGCTLGAIQEVCTGDGVDAADLVDLLARLVDRSLVVPAEPGGPWGARYRLLESVATYCLERLAEAGERDRVQALHDLYYTRVAECAEAFRYGPARRRWLVLLDAESVNLRAALESTLRRRDAAMALRLTGAMAWYWIQLGRLDEARRSLELALVEASEDLHRDGLARAGGDPELAARALEGLASARLLGGRDRHAARLLGAAAATGRPGTGAVRLVAAVRASLGEDEFAREFERGGSTPRPILLTDALTGVGVLP
ncbi:BTAD domain-containing putative transcriptional regulator [Spirillospora sp. CA-294931]|uniref:BTAD domain-containing putative transcriptional regulator n=1 Tax=Spirillospora sp. CA-294931 TaxID=3240042 RepID=UPI003D8EB142